MSTEKDFLRTKGKWVLGIHMAVSLLAFWPWLEYAASGLQHHLSVIAFSIPLSKLPNPKLGELEQHSLKVLVEALNKAMRWYNLPKTKSYQTFYSLRREHLGYIVTVARPDALQAVRFGLPGFGTFEYLGFFSRDLAVRFIRHYESLGYDVYTTYMGGYSTLGLLKEPIFSSSLNDSEEDLTALLFHELAHEKIYIKNNTHASERIAVFAEHQANKKFWGELPEHSFSAARVQRSNIIEAAKIKLQEVYESPEYKNQKKQILDALYKELGGKGDRPHWFNNAWLLLQSHYSAVPEKDLRDLFISCREDFECFFEKAGEYFSAPDLR